MKLKNPLLAVRDMERSKTFYREVLGLHVVMDFGANVTLTGGLCLQTLDTWTDFLGKEAEEIRFGANDSEVYFEEDDFDGFLASCDTIVMGRKAYEDCLSSLPEAAEKRFLVASRTPRAPEGRVVFLSADVVAEVLALKDRPGRGICGSWCTF